jgi:hypothetical protein
MVRLYKRRDADMLTPDEEIVFQKKKRGEDLKLHA